MPHRLRLLSGISGNLLLVNTTLTADWHACTGGGQHGAASRSARHPGPCVSHPLWLVPLAWSSNYLIARAAAGVISPHVLALGRWSLAFALMLPLAWAALRRAGQPWLAAEWKQLLQRFPLMFEGEAHQRHTARDWIVNASQVFCGHMFVSGQSSTGLSGNSRMGRWFYCKRLFFTWVEGIHRRQVVLILALRPPARRQDGTPFVPERQQLPH